MNTTIRTRFAPSPTGFLHLGGARTALYSWAYAKHHQGIFVLRVEDTDVERSTPEAVQAILDGMRWLGLTPDEGPFYQMKNMSRYREVIQQMLDKGTAYPCYSSVEAVEAMRETAKARGDKPRYDGTWRPETGKILPTPPVGISPVIRFKNPTTGAVAWNDMVKGTISINNEELDDFVIARAIMPDDINRGETIGVPTYNFCVVVDDWDMKITHVIRGDDHVNNTPRQINVLKALGATLPEYGHLPMILGSDGEKLSKRHGAVSVMQYDALGYLPEAVSNYLARLGWSHGDTELLSIAELVSWFDGTHLSKSAAQWDSKKLNWVNAHYLKKAPVSTVMTWLQNHHPEHNAVNLRILVQAVTLLKDRCETMLQLSEELNNIFNPPSINETLIAELITPNQMVLKTFIEHLTVLFNDADAVWDKASIALVIQNTLKHLNLKMPQLAMPVRVAMFGTPHTPSLDAMLALLDPEIVLKRLKAVLI